jgi:16S rRNA G966 N2-methylase RsmD
MGGLAKSLEVLAAEIRAEHQAFLRSARTTLEHGIRCGELLTQAKRQLRHGGWLPWLEREFGDSLSVRTAQEYMRVFRHRDELRAKYAANAHLGMRAALKEIGRAGPREGAYQPVLPDLPLQQRIEIVPGDFREVLAGADPESVDLVFTDPPYADESLFLWDELARVAARLLKPGGVLIAYSGSAHLPEVFRRVSEVEGLEYYWMIVVGHTHQHQCVKRYYSTYKPVITYCKTGRGVRKELSPDSLHLGNGNAKEYHHWGQPIEEAIQLIEDHCPQGGRVLDPMCGSATIPLAAVQTDRFGVGIEVDEGHYRDALQRIDKELGPVPMR